MSQAATAVSAARRADRLETMQPSAIRDVHNLAEQLQQASPDGSFIALHFGEPDAGTPEFVVEAGVEALRGGAVFYETNAGRVDLKAELAAYYRRIYGVEVAPERFVITCGGVQAIHLAYLGLLAPGDAMALVTPVWPNLSEAATIAGATVHHVPLAFDAGESRFHLDLNALQRVVADDPCVRLVAVNTPANPTGWVMSEDEKARLVTFCREHGLYLLGDEMYDRIDFRRAHPHSFLHLTEPEDRLVVINGFSKTYCMTGWRLGYLIAPAALAAKLAEMQEFVTSHAPSMAQVAGITALQRGEEFVAQSLERYRRLRDLTVERLAELPGATVARPDGTFYAFFRVRGSEDSVAFCKALLRETGVSLAPGKAFGAGGEGWLRLCFAKAPEQLDEALQRLQRFIAGTSAP